MRTPEISIAVPRRTGFGGVDDFVADAGAGEPFAAAATCVAGAARFAVLVRVAAVVFAAGLRVCAVAFLASFFAAFAAVFGRCALLAARGAGSATSRVTSLAGLSSRRPLNDGWRRTP